MENKTERKKRATNAVVKLRKLMAAKGMRQEPVALRLRVPLGTLNRWLNDRATPHSEIMIDAIEGFVKNPHEGD